MHAQKTLSRSEIDAMGERIAALCAEVDVTMHRLLCELRAFDEAGGWYAQGFTSCAHWLNWRSGVSLGTAREHLRVAHALAQLPRIDEALAAGRLSYSKARAITRVATPATEEKLLETARCSTAAQLEKICRLFGQAQCSSAKPGPDGTGQTPGEAIAQEDDRRWVRHRVTDDGMVRIELQLLPEEAARVLKAIESHADRPDRLADGACELAEATLRGAATERQPVEVRVHIEASTLTGATETGDGISAETSRRLCCDAGIVPVLEDDAGKVLDVGRRTRAVPAPIRRALERRHGRVCSFPGCTHRRFVDTHHLHHWLDGGETKVENLTFVCRRHHRFLHEHGFSVFRGDAGELVFQDPAGRVVPPTGEEGLRQEEACERVRQRLAREGREAAFVPAVPRWDGAPPDYGRAVDSLCLTARRAGELAH
jgi:hypothetical protein